MVIEPNNIYNLDCQEGLDLLDEESVDCLITSPPYWNLRVYGVGDLGLEPTPELYIKHLCDIFDKAKRVLKKTGTCWVNIRDTYSSGPNLSDRKKVKGINDLEINYSRPDNIPQKCLVGIPERFVLEMTKRGWIRRNTIIWYKPNAMPSSVKDRFTVDFEYIYFFVKNRKYWFKQQREPHVTLEQEMRNPNFDKPVSYDSKYPKGVGAVERFSETPRSVRFNPEGKNKRCVWEINTKPNPVAHFATYPPDLVEIMVKAGCPKDGIVLDPFAGSGTTLYTAWNLGRRYIGFEISEEYCEKAREELEKKCDIFERNTHIKKEEKVNFSEWL